MTKTTERLIQILLTLLILVIGGPIACSIIAGGFVGNVINQEIQREQQGRNIEQKVAPLFEKCQQVVDIKSTEYAKKMQECLDNSS